ncbi:hypothetical protein MCG98_05710 [Ruminococcus sp. OA3]|uniref:hypothetical protein n=1 Tax=Ruminococcus sp. OA3 TaxID=2914164 RepID=UPI001F055780|nr:hypothetical protein [Ruminococcus sp. OA3]MCH1982058.1 hypothetical protein [Ruminococcus sp. OA3]
MKKEVLRIQSGIKKSGIAERILDFSIQIYRDEICGLIVENNLERKCLVDLLAGDVRLDYGWVYFDEEELPSETYDRILKEYVFVMNRKEHCVRQLKVKEYVFVLHGGISLIAGTRKLCASAGLLFQELGCSIDPEEMIGNLLPHQRKEVELIHAYVSGKKLVVISDMDEFFTEESITEFFEMILKLKELGVDFLIVSNHTRVLFEYTEYMYVFSHGRTRHRILKQRYSLEHLYTVLLESFNVNENLPESKAVGPTVLTFEHVETDHCGSMCFKVHEGEILNFVNMDIGNWRILADILSGDVPVRRGKIFLQEKEFRPRMFSDAVEHGVGIIEENSYEAYSYFDATVLDNISMVMSRKLGINGFSPKYMKCLEEELLDTGEFTREELHKSVYQAGPYLLQKAAYYRWILFRPQAIVCLRPFSAADYNIQKLTQHLIRTAVQQGSAVIILTMSVSEASIMGERTIVMKSGSMYEKDRQDIGQLFE